MPAGAGQPPEMAAVPQRAFGLDHAPQAIQSNSRQPAIERAVPIGLERMDAPKCSDMCFLNDVVNVYGRLQVRRQFVSQMSAESLTRFGQQDSQRNRVASGSQAL